MQSSEAGEDLQVREHVGEIMGRPYRHQVKTSNCLGLSENPAEAGG